MICCSFPYYSRHRRGHKVKVTSAPEVAQAARRLTSLWARRRHHRRTPPALRRRTTPTSAPCRPADTPAQVSARSGDSLLGHNVHIYVRVARVPVMYWYIIQWPDDVRTAYSL